MTNKPTAYQIIDKHPPHEPYLYVTRVDDHDKRENGFIWHSGSASGFCDSDTYGLLPLYPGATFYHRAYETNVEVVRVNPKTVTMRVWDSPSGTESHTERWYV